MCLYPRIIKNKKYTKTIKNGGNIPAVSDNRVLAVPIGCGRCMECRKQEARKWQIRMLEDIRTEKNGIMVTLTFSDEELTKLINEINEERGYETKGYDLDNAIATLAVRRFTERWRKEHGKSVRHWLITELGHKGTENIHMHGIIWTDKDKSEIKKHWGYGYTWEGTFVTEKTINYIIKYVHKQDQDHKEYKPKILTSKGIGKGYTERVQAETNKYKEGETKEYYVTRTGHKIAMPVYWRNKIYNDDEREKLWLEKLDKQERWVNGIRIDVSEGDDEYYKVLDTAREKNERLGYQNGTVDWNQKKYEEERRWMLQRTRIERAEESLRGLGDAPESAESVNDSLRSESAIKPNEKWD